MLCTSFQSCIWAHLCCDLFIFKKGLFRWCCMGWNIHLVICNDAQCRQWSVSAVSVPHIHCNNMTDWFLYVWSCLNNKYHNPVFRHLLINYLGCFMIHMSTSFRTPIISQKVISSKQENMESFSDTRRSNSVTNITEDKSPIVKCYHTTGKYEECQPFDSHRSN